MRSSTWTKAIIFLTFVILGNGFVFASSDNPDVQLRLAAMTALVQLGDSSVPVELCRILKEDPSPEVRAEAARLMGEHLANSPGAVVPCLQASLKEERQRLVMGESSVEVVVAADEEALRRLGAQAPPEGTERTVGIGIGESTPSPMPGIGATTPGGPVSAIPEIPSAGWHFYDREGNEISVDFSAAFRDVLKTLPEEVVDASWTRESGMRFTVTEGKEKRRYLTAKEFSADGDLLHGVELIYYVPTTLEGQVLASAGIRAAVYQYGYKKSKEGIGSVKEGRAKGEMIAGDVERKSLEQALGGVISEIGAVKDRAEFVHYLASGGDLLLTVAKLEGNNTQQYLSWTVLTRVVNKELPPNGFIESVTEIGDQQLKVRRKVQKLANFAVVEEQNDGKLVKKDKPGQRRDAVRVVEEWVEEWIINSDGNVTGGRIDDQTWLQDFSNWLDPSAQAAAQSKEKEGETYYEDGSGAKHEEEIEWSRKRIEDLLKRLKKAKKNGEYRKLFDEIKKMLNDPNAKPYVFSKDEQEILSRLDSIVGNLEKGGVDEETAKEAVMLMVEMEGVNYLSKRLESASSQDETEIASLAAWGLGEMMKRDSTGRYSSKQAGESLVKALNTQGNNASIRIAAAKALGQASLGILLERGGADTERKRDTLLKDIDEALSNALNDKEIRKDAAASLMVFRHFDPIITKQVLQDTSICNDVMVDVIGFLMNAERNTGSLESYWAGRVGYREENGEHEIIPGETPTRETFFGMINTWSKQLEGMDTRARIQASKVLVEAMTNDLPDLSVAVMEALQGSRDAFRNDANILVAVNQALNNPHPSVRGKAARTLAIRGHVGVLPTLERMVQDEKDKTVQREALAGVIAFNPYRALALVKDDKLLEAAADSWTHFPTDKSIRQNANTVLEELKRRKGE